jgi:hypothetical protein
MTIYCPARRNPRTDEDRIFECLAGCQPADPYHDGTAQPQYADSPLPGATEQTQLAEQTHLSLEFDGSTFACRRLEAPPGIAA